MSNVKRLIADTFLFGLTLVLAIEFVLWAVDGGVTEDLFVDQAAAFTAGFAAIFGVSAVLAYAVGDAPTIGRRILHPRIKAGRAWAWHLAALFVLTLWLSLRVTEASLFELLDRRGVAGAARLWSGLSHPNFALLPRAIVLAAETVLIAFLATTLAVPAAFVLAFFAARNLMRARPSRVVYVILRFALNVSRSIEPLIWALIFTVWVGVGPFAGMLALLMHSVASLTKYYSELIEAVDEGPLDAIRSTGATPFQVVWYAVVPQVALPYIGMTVYRWDTNVRMATVIGLVGGGGIGTLLIQYQGQAMWPEVGCIVMVIAVIVWILDVISARIREALK